jgi:hypothetical protein
MACGHVRADRGLGVKLPQLFTAKQASVTALTHDKITVTVGNKLLIT